MDWAIARVQSPDGDVVGSGFLIDSQYLLTCTHVVLRALGRGARDVVGGGDIVCVDFPLIASGRTVRATVAVSIPVEDDVAGDISVLRLIGEPPPGLEPARLVLADEVWGHPFRAFGFPPSLDHGVWASGTLRAPQGAGWVQMEGGESGYAVEAGFSGGAVWDDELAGVVGMTVAADSRSDLRAAFLIPSTTLMQAWPPLAEGTLPPCPYRGLYPFRPSDAQLFYGREDVTERLVREALRRPVLAVVGPSGSGKSSVVFAGVIPRLGHEQGWMTVSVRPAQASSPLFALAAALVPVLEPDLGEIERLSAAEALTTVLRDGRLPDVVDSILARAQLDHFLLVVDQMEELFTRALGEVQDFTRALLSVLRRPGHARSGTTVLLTLRADFLGSALQDPGFAEALEDSVITIGQMRREQLRAVIEEPLPTGVRYEAGLVERILGDVGDEPGSLPLLEFALTLLWERQQGGLLTHVAYQELGGVNGALARYAERVYSEQLAPDDQEEARRLFVQLVRPADIGSSVRRVARRSELGEPRWQLGQRLAATRLLVADRDAAGAESVELVHEALIDGWSRLQQWTKADRAFREWQERLRGALAAWESVRRDAGGLLRGATLVEAERWLQERPDDLGETERQFIGVSREWRGRSVRRLRIAIAALTVLLVIATGLGGFAAWQSGRLAEQVRLASSRSIVSQSQQLVGYQPDVAMLLAAAAYQVAQTPEAVGAVTRLATKERQVDRLVVTNGGPVFGVDFDPTDPNRITLYGLDSVTIWDVARGMALGRWHSEGKIDNVASSADGRIIAIRESGAGVGGLMLWFPAEERTISIPDVDIGTAKMAFSPDGAVLAVCDPTQITVWEIGSQRLRTSVAKDTQSCEFGFTDSNTLVYLDRSEIVLLDLAENRAIARTDTMATGIEEGVQPTLAVAPDGGFGIVGDGLGSMTVWDLDRLVMMGDLGQDLYGEVAFTPNGRWAAIGGFGAAVLVDLPHRRQLKSYSRNDGNLGNSYTYIDNTQFALSPDGKRLVFPAGGNALALIETGETGDVPGGASELAVAPGPGEHLVALGPSGEVTVQTSYGVDAAVVVPPPAFVPDPPPILSPDGQHLASPSEQLGEVVLTNVADLQKPATRLAGGSSAVDAMAFDSVDGRFFASADASAVTVWSVDDGVLKARVALGDGMRVAGVAVHHDGFLVAIRDTAGNAFVIDSNSGERSTLPMRGVRALRFSPDGRWISVRTDTDIQVWDVTLRRALPVRLPAAIDLGGTPETTFSPDGTYLAAAHVLDGYSRTSVWRVEDGQLIGEVGGSASDIAFLPDGRRLAVATWSGLFVSEFDPRSAVSTICRVVGRDLTNEEWDLYGDQLGREPACP